MKREVIFIAVILMVVACLTGFSLAQEKKGQHREGVILPESTPPSERKPSRDDFLVDITSMDVRESASGPTFIIKGVSKYPDGTNGTISLKFYERVLKGTNRFVQIKNKRFEVTFQASKLWAGKRFFPGHYEVEVQVNPKQQSRSIRAKIKKVLGPMATSLAYRNKYVTVGNKEARKKAENTLKDYYIDAIKAAAKLYTDLDEKFKAAKVKFTSQFYKLDKNGDKKLDPNNKKAWLVDLNKFKKYLRDNPNEFYDRSGEFKEDAWRGWLDNAWRAEWKRAFDAHERVKGNYAALAWPDQYDQMTTALKMLWKRSGDNSISLYKWIGLPPSKKDESVAMVGDDPNGGVVKTSKTSILRVIKEIRLKLRLREYIKEKQAEEDKGRKKNK